MKGWLYSRHKLMTTDNCRYRLRTILSTTFSNSNPLLVCTVNVVFSEFNWPGKTEATNNTRYGGRNQVVQVTVSWGGQFQDAKADVVESFVVNAHNFISVFNKLMDGESDVIWFNNRVRDLWWWDNGVSQHHTVRVFFTNLRDEESSPTRTGTTTKRVGDLETLEAITRFGFLSDDIENGVSQFSTFGVVTFSTMVTSSRLTENKVIRAEELTIRTSTDGFHRSWFRIQQNSTRDLASSGGFSIHWFFPIEDQSLQSGIQMGQCHVRLRWLLRTWHRFVYHTDQLVYGWFHAWLFKLYLWLGKWIMFWTTKRNLVVWELWL